ncbi:MAG: autotransporter-associated beta strand repeat-containing protein [Candidatus Sumerlaeota bacterium]|nr:autotransporter-associated beta strand repeat-containing protein [Candidatus Sumerlaeota bacterium]
MFEGVAGTVTVNATQQANSVTFNLTSYTLTGGTIQMGNPGYGPGYYIINNGTATIASTLTNSGAGNAIRIGKSGYAGTLALSGAFNALTANNRALQINAGVLELQTATTSLGGGTGGISVASGATLVYNNSGTVAWGTVAATTLSGGGTFIKKGAGTLIMGSGGQNVTFNFGAGALIEVQAGQLTGSSSNRGKWNTNLASLNIASGATMNYSEAGGSGATAQIDALTGPGTLMMGYYGNEHLKIGVNNGSGNFTGVFANNTGRTFADVTKAGTGTQIFSGANTYTATTIVSAGTLKLNNELALQNSPFNTDGAGTLDLASVTAPTFGGLTGAANFTLPANVTALTLNVGAGRSLAYSGALGSAGNVALSNNGAGTQIISGVSDFTGPTTLNAGTFDFAAGGALPNSDITVKNTATLQVDTPGTTLKSLAIENGVILNLAAVNSGASGVNTTIANALTFTGTPSFSVRPIFAAPAQAGDTFNLLTAGSIVNTPGTMTADFSINGVSRMTGSITMVGNNMVLTILTAAADLAWDNGAATGVWNLNTDTNFSAGQTFMQNDRVTFGDAAAGAVTLTGNLYPTSITVNSSANYTFSGTGGINGIAALTKDGPSTLTLSNTASAFTGGTTVSAGVLQASTPAALPGAVVVSDNGTLNLISPGAVNPLTFANNISGSGKILVTLSGGATNTNLSGASTGFTGTLELYAAAAQGNKLNASNLNIGPTALIKINPYTQLFVNAKNLPNPIQMIGTGNSENRGAIRLNTYTLSGPITLLGDASIGPENGFITGAISGGVSGLQTLTLGAPSSTLAITVTGPISDGAGTLAILHSSGVPTLAGANTYSGGTTLNNGNIFTVTTSTALGSGPVVVNAVANARLYMTKDLNIGNPLTIHGGGTNGAYGVLHFNAASAAESTIYSGNITIDGAAIAGGGHFGSGNNGLLDLTGIISYPGGGITSRIGVVRLSNSGSNYTTLTIQQGTTMLGVTNAIPTAANLVIGASGASYLDLAGYDQTLASVTKSPSYAATIGNSSMTSDSLLTITGDSIYAGVIQDITTTGTMKTALKVTGGPLTLSGANNYSGGTTLQSGQLNINSATAIGGTTSTFVINGGTFDNTSAADLLLLNNNAQNWNGDFAYAGSLRNLNLGTGAVTLTSSPLVTVSANTLTIGGDISGSSLGLTKAGAGTLVVQGANTYNGATTINAGTLEIAGVTTNSDITVKNSGVLQLDDAGKTLKSLVVEDGATLALPALYTGAANANTTVTNALAFTATPPNFTVRPLFGVTPRAGDTFNLLTAGSVVNAAGIITADFGGSLLIAGTVAMVGNNLILTIITGATDLVWDNNGGLGTGIWNISADANFTGQRFNQYDSVTFGDTGAGAVTLVGALLPSAVTVNSSINYTFFSLGSIGGMTALNKSGVSTLTLSTANTYTGGTNVNGGGIIAGADNNFGGTAIRNPITLNGGMLQPSANITLNPNHPLVLGPGGGALNGTLTFGFLALPANMLSGSTTLTITGSGATNTVLQPAGPQPGWTGPILINSARINIYNAPTATLGSGPITVGGGSASLYLNSPGIALSNPISIQSNGGENRGAVRFQSGGTLNGPVTLLNNAGFSCESAVYPVYLNGNISGPFALQINGLTGSSAAAVYYLNGVNTFTGNLTLPNGTIKIGNSAAIPSGPGTGNLVLNGAAAAGTVDLNGFDATINGLAGATGAVLGKVINSAAGTSKTLTAGYGDATTLFAGLLADNTGAGGGLALTKVGTGTLTLSAANTYSGATTILNGVLP